jgi:predicted adenylyl cyclase CyaB
VQNLELKARCPDIEMVRAHAERLGARYVGAFAQRDTFFASGAPGRLKLREVADGPAELIAYRRADLAAARWSDYDIYPVTDPDRLRAVLTSALGEAGVVEKRRRLYLLEHTRIHLDEVRGLGDFVELETVLDGEPDAAAHAELVRIAAGLGIERDALVAVAYVDLLNAHSPG